MTHVSFSACLAAAYALLVSMTSAYAQGSDFGVEGHVFSKSTNRALPGAFVQVFQYGSPSSPGISATLNSDNTGFYGAQLQILAVDPSEASFPATAIEVTCVTKRRTYATRYPFYFPIQSGTVYSRDYYIDVPSSVKQCIQ